MDNSIPKDFESWKNCIEKQCKIPLTKDFIQSRIRVYEDLRSDETQRFIRLYGETHYRNILLWYHRAAEEY